MQQTLTSHKLIIENRKSAILCMQSETEKKNWLSMDFPPTLLHALENFPLLDQDKCSRPSVEFSRLTNQTVTLIEI